MFDFSMIFLCCGLYLSFTMFHRCMMEGFGIWILQGLLLALLWYSAIFAGMWCLWLEWNAGVFNQQFLLPYLLWEKIIFMSSLSIFAYEFFRGIPSGS